MEGGYLVELVTAGGRLRIPAGFGYNDMFPISKLLWTSSMVLISAILTSRRQRDRQLWLLPTKLHTD